MKRVRFLCTGNSCRSQMAEGWCRPLLPSVEAHSAGTKLHAEFERGVDPLAALSMQKAGVGLSSHRAKLASDLVHLPFDLVVSACDKANKTCRAFPGPGKRVHVPFDDPPALAIGAKCEAEAMAHYERVRDEIRDFVRTELPKLMA
jgi:arsenate reductase